MKVYLTLFWISLAISLSWASGVQLMAQEVQPTLTREQAWRLQIYLSRYDAPPAWEELQALELPNLKVALFQLIDDPKVMQTARGRAILMLWHFPLEEIKAFVETHVDAQSEQLYIQDRFLKLIDERLLERDPQWALGLLSPFVKHSDGGIRARAAQGLMVLRRNPKTAAAAHELLLQMAFKDQSPSVKAVFESASDWSEQPPQSALH